MYFRVVGVALDVPVWVPKPSVDLKICMYGRLYQDSILVHTRSKAALRLKFEVCPELRGHMELLPETGYIQALSSYTVQLKFLPRHSLPEDAHKYFDPESRVLEAPMTIWVADQVKPVGFTVHAVVTTSDLEMTPSQLDFGHCTVYEAVRAEIDLFNHSLLPQEFGFVGLPKFVDIQPNDGFGTILPLETVQLEVTFQPTRAKEYSFELVCKSEINRCFKLSCRAVGVHPPLELSHYHIKFAATALYSTSVAAVYVINSHLSMNSLTHSVPRIGSEEPSPVGPTSFEFLLPPDSPITISPSVGTVLPGKRCLVQVAFRPVLPNDLIRQEALQTLSKDTESKSVPGRGRGMGWFWWALQLPGLEFPRWRRQTPDSGAACGVGSPWGLPCPQDTPPPSAFAGAGWGLGPGGAVGPLWGLLARGQNPGRPHSQHLLTAPERHHHPEEGVPETVPGPDAPAGPRPLPGLHLPQPGATEAGAQGQCRRVPGCPGRAGQGLPGQVQQVRGSLCGRQR